MKEKVFIDTERAATLWDDCQNALPAIQRVIDELKKTGCEFSMRELWNIIQHHTTNERIVALIMDKKQNGETPQIFGIKLSRAKMLEMVEPENLDEIRAAIIDANGVSWEVQKFVKIKGGTAYVDNATRKEIEEYCAIYATNAKERRKAELIKSAAATLNELITLGVISNHSMVYDAPQIRGLTVVAGSTCGAGWTYAPDVAKMKEIIADE